MVKKVVIALILVLIAIGVYVWRTPATHEPIGGERDEYGCLGPAGFSYDTEIGACARSWEMTPDIKAAAKLAVDLVGKGYALTVVSFNSYEEAGAYDIMLERGVERTAETIYIRDRKASSKKP